MKRKSVVGVIFLIAALYTFGAAAITKKSSVSTYVTGEVVTYILRVDNTDAADQGGVAINDDMSSLPLENFGSVSVDTGSGGDGGTYGISGGIFTATGITIGADSYVEYEFTSEVSAGAAGDITNTVDISGSGISGSDSVTLTELDQPASVSIVKSSDVGEYDNGEDIVYTIRLENSSGNTLKDLLVEDDFTGLGLTNLEVTEVQKTGVGTDPAASAGAVTGGKFEAAGAVLGPNGSITYRIKGEVESGRSSDIVNTAGVTVAGSKKSSTDTLSRTVYDYSLEKSIEGGGTTYLPGGTITYLVKLTNNKGSKVKGLEISDLLSGITSEITGGGTGPAFDMSATTITGTTTGVGSSTGLSSNPLSGDLVAADAVIGPDGSIQYRIETKVNSNVIGEIRNQATITETTRGDNTKVSNEVAITGGQPIIEIEKTVDVSRDYLPGDTMKYTVTVSNNGGGFGEEYSVTDLLSGITTTLANDSTQAVSSADITGVPFAEGTVELTSIGSNSISANYTLNTPVNSLDLDDRVYIAPGESIEYEVSGVTGPSAIGEIANKATVSSASGYNKSTPFITTTPKALNTADIDVTKTTSTVEYQPGTTVVYDIVVKNNKLGQFVNNFNLVDKINSIEAEQVDGSTGRAFSSWTLNVVDPTNSQNGTKPGTAIAGSSGTSDINIDVDIAPGEFVEYQLVAVIGSETVGRIVDGDIPGDNVPESGEGIIMSTPKLNVAKIVNDTEYSPNEVIEYRIIVENDGRGYAVDIPVVDELSKVVSTTGATAYSGWEITSAIEAVPGSTDTPSGNSGIAVEPLVDTDLNVLADIGPETRLVYTIKATMDGRATGWIQNEVSADGNLVADKGVFPVEPDVRATKTASPQWYSDEEPLVITYTLSITNEGDAGYAQGVRVEDDLKDIGVELLNGSSLTEAFETVSVSTTLNGSGTESATNGGIVDGVLTDTVNITAGGSVVYTITAGVKKDIATDTIPYGTISNSATITPVDIEGKPDTPFDVGDSTRPKQPRLSIIKATPNTNFVPGSSVVYNIRIDNSGAGYANNARVTDVLSSAFSSWTIATATDTPYRGSNADINSELQDNQNIDVTADIAPGGYVEYIITAVVDSNYTGDVINNTAKVVDSQSGNSYESSADVTDAAGSNRGLFITKKADKFSHIPGSPLTYTIDIYNTTDTDIVFGDTGYRVLDRLSEIESGLANDGSNPPADITGYPFENIVWSGSDGRSGSIGEGQDFEDQPTVPAAVGGNPGKYTYTMTMDVKESVLPGKMRNAVYLVDGGNALISKGSLETNRGGNFGTLTREVNIDRYRPGEELIYRVKATGGTDGYMNNLDIDEGVNSISVPLIDGGSGNPYYNPDIGNNEFTVDVYINGVLNGTPNSGGTSRPSNLPDNTDISDTLDIAPGDEIEYVIKGNIRPDADGTINYSGHVINSNGSSGTKTLVTDPYRHNLIVNKRTREDSYEPGEEVTFLIEIRNNSDGNAGQIDIEDEISNLTVELSDGSTGAAFEPMEWSVNTLVEQIGAEDYTVYADGGAYGDNTDINTKFNLPIDTKLTYEITGRVNSKAVGDINNTATIEGDKVTGQVGPYRADLDADKSIVAYYDRDGTATITGGYKPGGWIEYLMYVENTAGKGIQNNLPAEDKISEITTTYADGSTGQAFSTWSISLDSSTTSENSTVPGLGLWDSNPALVLVDKDLVEGNPDNPNTNPDLSATEVPLLIDIAPGGRVALRVKARVDERAIGSIENIVSSGRSRVSSGRSEMLPPDVRVQKKAYEADSSGNLTSTEKTTYNPGDTFYYVIKAENRGQGISIGSSEDLLTSIKAEVPETAGSGTNPKENPFTTWEVTAVRDNSEVSIGRPEGPDYNDGNDNVTAMDDFEASNPQIDSDIDSGSVYIAPAGIIEYTVKATIKDNILTRIRNTMKYSDQPGNKSNRADLNPVAPTLEVLKEITYIGDDPSGKTDPQTNYSPGNYVIYEVELRNTGESFGNNIEVKDSMSSIIGEVSGGGNDQSFISWVITDDGGLNPDTYVPAYDPAGDLDVEIDIAQGDTVTFTITALIRDNLVGQIPVNTVNVSGGDTGEITDTSDPVDPKDSDILYYKTFVEIVGGSSAVEIPSFEYLPFGNIYYKIVVRNEGEGYGNNIVVRDLIGNLVDGKGDSAFSSHRVYPLISDKDGNETVGTTDGKTVISGSVTGGSAIDVAIDLEPKAKVELYIEATVEGAATGDITNIVDIPAGTIDPASGKTDRVTATLTNAQVTGIKKATAQYTPGGNIQYNLEIRNSSDSNVAGLGIVDIIKNIQVEAADGTQKPALKPGWSITATVEDDEGNSDITALQNQISSTPEDSIDIKTGDGLILGSRENGKPYSILKIDIEGTIIDDAVGIITNNMTLQYGTDLTTTSAFTVPKPGEIRLKKTPVTSRTDETEDESYTPGEEKTFLIEVENTGEGYALGVEIEDVVTNILTRGAGNFDLPGGAVKDHIAFNLLDVRYEAIDSGGAVSNLTQVVGTPDTGGGFSGEVNIAPGETFKVWITVDVTSEAIEDIVNTATAVYDGTQKSSDATIVSVPGNISISKEISRDGTDYNSTSVNYIPGDTIYYRISVENTGTGWGNDIGIMDRVNQIVSEQSGGGSGNAFETSSISVSYSGIDARYILINESLKELETLFDLEPLGTVTFDISGRVNSNITGQIDNSALYGSLGGDFPQGQTNIVSALPTDAALIITKEVVGGDTEYAIGSEVHYRVSVENTSDSFANDLKIADDISSIPVDSSVLPSPAAAFSGFSVGPPVFNNPDTKIVSADYTTGIDALVDLAPKDTISFDIYATVIGTAVGDIVNTAEYEYNGGTPVEAEVTLNPKKAKLTIDKVSLTQAVIPGEETVFRISVSNTGEGIADDVVLTDDLSVITALLSDGSTGAAFETGSVGAGVVQAMRTTPASPLIDVTDDRVETQLDIAPGGTLIVEIRGILTEDIVGSITNKGEYEYTNNGDTQPTTGEAEVTIGPGNADISLVKNAVVDPAIGGYIPGDGVEFEILLSNAGPGIANNINITDDISGIMVETASGDKQAFSSWRIDLVDGGSIAPPTSVPGVFPVIDSDLDIQVDIAPGDTLKFKVTATVIGDAYGEITNTATATYENGENNDGTKEEPKTDDATFIPSRSAAFVEKKVSIDTYAPGDEITYTIRVGNTGPGPANRVEFEDVLPRAMTTTGIGDALDLTTLVIFTSTRGGVTEDTPVEVDMTGDSTLRSVLTIPRDGEIEYTVTANIAKDVIGRIENTATAPYIDNDGTDKTSGDLLPKSETVITLPKLAEVRIDKTADKDEFTAGEDIRYTVTVENTGEGIANDVKLSDLIKSIEIQSVDEKEIPAFTSVVITDNSGEISEISSIGSYNPAGDLDVSLDIAPGDKIIFTLVGTTDPLAAGDITNEASFTFTNNDGSIGTGSAEVVSEVKLNEGELILTKDAFQKEVEKGGVVEYEILVRNTTEVYFLNVSIEDKIPAGFSYIEGTTEMNLTGPDGDFDTDDDKIYTDDPVQGNTLSFRAVDIGPKEVLRIRYLLRASIGTTFGKYTNTAYAVSGGKEVSNRDSATVEVIPDDLFDTATIIGKVYEDLNGDGYQADATAKRITLKGGVSEASYVPDTTTMEIGGAVEVVPDASPPLQHGVTIGKLWGVSRNRKIKEPNKAVIRYETTDASWEALTVTSKAGTILYIDKDGRVTEDHKGDVKEGLASERLKVTRNIYKQKGKSTYLQEIIVENLGIYEDGIPGVRLITVDGIVVETDEFGRYHVPDEWVLRKTGKNFIIKVDPDTLPQGMEVISENPRVRRISPNGLSKFNFSIQRVDDDFDIGDEEGVVTVRGDENE